MTLMMCDHRINFHMRSRDGGAKVHPNIMLHSCIVTVASQIITVCIMNLNMYV